MPVPSCVDVRNVEDGDGPFDVVHDLKHLFEAAPKFLPSGGLDTNLGRCAVLDPWENGEFVLVIVPNFVNAVHDARKHVGHLLVRRLSSPKLAVVTRVERDVAGIDGSCGLQGGFDFRQRASSLHPVTEKF